MQYGIFFRMKKVTFKFKWILLLLALLLLITFDLRWGSVSMASKTFFNALSDPTGTSAESIIIWKMRIPRIVTAILAGAGLGLSGLWVQGLFRNPIAGPYVLGLSGGAGTGVALVLLGGAGLGIQTGKISLTLAAALGSIAVLLLDLWLYKKLKDPVALLVAGIMIGAFSGSLLSILSYFAPARKLQRYMFWAMGNLQLSWQDGIGIMALAVISGLLISLWHTKHLNALLLGENYAVSMGINVRRIHFLLILLTGMVAGTITAFTGPLAFVGLTAPHLAGLIFHKRTYQYLIPATVLTGSLLMLFADWISQLPGNAGILPVNSITSLIGAPLVILLIFGRNFSSIRR